MHSLTRRLKCFELTIMLVLSAPALGAFDSTDLEPGPVPAMPPSTSAVFGSEKSLDELAQQLANPLAALTSLSYAFEYRAFQGKIPGAGNQTQWANVFQPVIPFGQKNGRGFVLRLTLPIYFDQPVYKADREYPEWLLRQTDPARNGGGNWTTTHGHSGALGFDFVYGGTSDSGLILMYGVAGELPTSSDTSNAKQQIILGPELNIGKAAAWGTYGFLASHVIDVAEKKGKNTPDTSITSLQAYFSYALDNGWQVFSNPAISYDWEGDSGNKLALPLGIGLARTARVGKLPVRLAVELQNYVATTDRFGTDWSFRFTFSPVLPNKFTRTQ